MQVRKRSLYLIFVIFVFVALAFFASAQQYFRDASGNLVPSTSRGNVIGYDSSGRPVYGASSLNNPNVFNPSASNRFYPGYQERNPNYYGNNFGSRSFAGSGYYSGYVNRQPYPTLQSYYGGQISTYWPILGDAESCRERQDLILNVPPAGCTPAVVRSDLLAEQNVPVFCQIDSFKINPLIDISSVRSIRFTGDYPPEITGVGFHPARAALNSRERLLGAPLINNIGYVVVVLRRQPDESKLPDFVNVTLGAQIDYISGNSLGIGKSEFILSEVSDADWEREKFKQSFWNGRYFVRLEEAQSDFATVSIYNGDRRVMTQRVQRGGTSQNVFLPGLYCRAGLQISYDGYVSADQTAKIEVSDSQSTDVYEVSLGSRFGDERCGVNYMEIGLDGESGRVVLYCEGKSFELVLGQRLVGGENFSFGGESVRPVRKGYGYDLNLNGLQKETRRGEYVFEFNGVLAKRNSTTGALIPIVNYKGEFIGTGYSPEDATWARELWTEMTKYTGVAPRETQALNNNQSRKFFLDAVNDYERVVDYYPNERNTEALTIPYGQKAMEEGISLARDFGDDEIERRLINKMLDNYQNPENELALRNRLAQSQGFDSSLSVQSVEVEDGVKTIRLLGFNSPKEKSSVEILVDGVSRNVNVRGAVNSQAFGREQLSLNGEFVVDSVDPESARVTAYCIQSNGVISTYGQSYILRVVNPEILVCGVPMKLIRTNSREAAKIRLYPTAQGTQTVTNFSVHIGIEKRGIEIAPDKAREKIENLNETIKEWEDISQKLGNVITGMKSACFATSAVLTFKNFATGLSGEALARQQVMNGENGWRNRCAALVGTQDGAKYPTMDACYIANSGEIDAEVAKTTDAITKVNQRIQAIQDQHVTSNDIFGQSVDATKLREALAAEARSTYGTTEIDLSNLSRKYFNSSGAELKSISINDLLSEGNLKNGAVSTDAIKQLMLNAELKGGTQGGQLDNVDSYMTDVAARINDQRIAYEDLEKAKAETSKGWGQAFYADTQGQQIRAAPVVRINEQMKNQIAGPNKNVAFDSSVTHSSTVVVPPSATENKAGQTGKTFKGGRYYLGLTGQDSGAGVYGVKQIYSVEDGKILNPEETAEFTKLYGIGNIRASDRVGYNNQIIGTDRQCKYYETEPYRGMPAVVPFDYRNGWYAATRQTLPMFGGIGAFDASGRVTSFWMCNVGDNGRIEFESGFGDDLCQQVNLNTGQPLGTFPGLSDNEARTKITQAVNAIEQASRQYPNKVITINGERCEVGAPSAGQPGTSCQDFMSPKDCLLMFNVCDPVVCPSSRCNLGGQYPVSNVPQTGIVGSVFLCLPNIREGIAIPVCLTGIQAGIDGWISIMRNYRDCLQENLESGETVGICDQIHSIYVCEFFWGQVAPFVNVIIPKLLEVAYGQGVRGGGEYLTVQSSWQNMENSINYFTNSYAQNSLNAFRVRTQGTYGSNPYSTASITELGTSFCKNFASVKAPNAFKALVEPESPPQFHAWFDEKAYTTATVPATSQYKVFYHIFAGNDAGIQYSVYLRNPPESSYYATNPQVIVASGFIARGEYASNTRDFTAPQGYKELCVRINTEEECGFGQVSTSFAVNYLRDAYVNSEITQQSITSERVCVGGSNNPGALLNPNIQAGVEETVSPTIYNRGVVRICSTDNPGKGTDPTRFVNMGYCDDPKVGCWLDKRSVDNALTANNVGLRNETLEFLEGRMEDYLVESGEVFNDEQAQSELRSLTLAMNDLGKETDVVVKGRELLNRIDFVAPMMLLNGQKAELQLIRGKVNDQVARVLKRSEDLGKPQATVPTGVPTQGDLTGPPFAGSVEPHRFSVSSNQVEISDSNAQTKVFYNQLVSNGQLTEYFVDKNSGTKYTLYYRKNGEFILLGSFEQEYNWKFNYLQGPVNLEQIQQALPFGESTKLESSVLLVEQTVAGDSSYAVSFQPGKYKEEEVVYLLNNGVPRGIFVKENSVRVLGVDTSLNWVVGRVESGNVIIDRLWSIKPHQEGFNAGDLAFWSNAVLKEDYDLLEYLSRNNIQFLETERDSGSPIVPTEPEEKTYQINSFEYISNDEIVQEVEFGEELLLLITHTCDYINVDISFEPSNLGTEEIINDGRFVEPVYQRVLMGATEIGPDDTGEFISKVECRDSGNGLRGISQIKRIRVIAV